MSQAPAFDVLAPTYDADFTGTPIARYLRGITQARLAQAFPSGSRALELGCGTGEDALWLAGRGVQVTATDSSAGMLAAARAKCADDERVRVAALNLAHLPDSSAEPALAGTFDGAYSNFGPLNCLSEWRTLAAWLAARLRPGAVAAFGIMSPLCLWEPLWYGLHGDVRTATRRLRGKSTFRVAGSNESLPITYPTVRQITQHFVPHFQRRMVRGLGVFLPPSAVYGAMEKRPRLLRTLIGLENRLGGIPQLALLADHYWIEFVRV
jgi:SAM-dependent methyltransferase